jgi:hypothetical protein
MSRSKNNRREKTASGESPSSEGGSAASQSTAFFYPPESPSTRQKWLLVGPVIMELIWLAYLVYLITIK